MKRKQVLLVGEYSGVHKHLKLGLKELGIDTRIISDGDRWKAIGGNDYPLRYPFSESYNRWLRAYSYVLSPIIYIFKYRLGGYQVVQFMDLLRYYPMKFRRFIFWLYKLFNKKLVICAAGNNNVVYDAYRKGAYRYFVYNGLSKEKRFSNDYEQNVDYDLARRAEKVIPIAYEYAEAFRISLQNPRNLGKAIPAPIHLELFPYKENKLNEKMVIFHGLNEFPEIKGTEIIIRAMEKFKESHQDDVELILKGGVPFAEYMDIVYSANIVIDQCMSYCTGLSGLFPLATGRIVMGGAEQENLDELGMEESPIINILPNEEDILEKLEMLYNRRDGFTQMGHASRVFVEKYHDSLKVARQYLEAWGLS